MRQAHRAGATPARRAATTTAAPRPEPGADDKALAAAQEGTCPPETAPKPDPDRPDVLGPDEDWLTAEDHALGRRASRPSEIPARGWRAVLRRVWAEASGDQIPMVAASCGFYGLLALFPAISVLISLYGLMLNPAQVEGQLQALNGVLPRSAFDMIAQRVHDLAASGSTKLSWGLVLGLLFAIYSATSGTKSILNALNVAYEENEKRSFLRYNLVALLFTLGGILGVTVALAIIVGVPAALNFTWLGPAATLGIRIVSSLLLLLFVILGLAVLYRFGPSRQEPRWHWVTPGSVLAGTVWLLASLLFSFYVANFASYDATYGSLGAVVVLAMWFYISAFVVLLGAELNAELELQTRRDTTSGPAKPMGERGAFVADHVATS